MIVNYEFCSLVGDHFLSQRTVFFVCLFHCHFKVLVLDSVIICGFYLQIRYSSVMISVDKLDTVDATQS